MRSNLVLRLRSSAFLIVDSTFHGQWHVFGVRHQAPCSGKFAWLGNRPSLANRTGASVEVTVSPSRACYLAHFRLEISAAKAAAQRKNTILGQLVTRCHRLNWS